MTTKQTPPPLTQTWVFIGFANEFNKGKAKPVHFMNRDLVVWRTQSGTISLLDAYCPHMGAHLGYGKIKGEKLECIFHKRSFTTEGICSGNGKNNKSYPISIIQNMVFAWFGETKPTWEMPDFLTGFTNLPESRWKIFKSKMFNDDFHPKDLLDNTVDATHFKTFHEQCINYKPVEILESSPHSFISKNVYLGHPKLKKRNKELELELIAESYGPCTLVVNSTVKILNQIFSFKFLFLCTPIEKENTNYTLALAVRSESKRRLSLGRRIVEYLYNQYAFFMQIKEFKRESELIWRFKTFLTHPDLYPHENAMNAFTEWYSQFYITNAGKGCDVLENIKVTLVSS